MAATPAERGEALSILGLPSDAMPEQVLRAYRRLSKETHPDATGHSDRQADRRFAAVSDAYRRLTVEPVSLLDPGASRPTPPIRLVDQTEPLIVTGPARVSPTRARPAQSGAAIVAGQVTVTPGHDDRRTRREGRQ